MQNADQNIENKLDFETFKMLEMYAGGRHVADIADHVHLSVNAFYARFKEFPEDYQSAKDRLLKFRNAKYRRVGALSIDIQLQTLEHYHELLLTETTSEDCKEYIRSKIKDISAIGESAERRADLNEGKVTERLAFERPLSLEEQREIFLKAQQAGNGLDTESIKP